MSVISRLWAGVPVERVVDRGTPCEPRASTAFAVLHKTFQAEGNDM
jgi:hypothetical protein